MGMAEPSESGFLFGGRILSRLLFSSFSFLLLPLPWFCLKSVLFVKYRPLAKSKKPIDQMIPVLTRNGHSFSHRNSHARGAHFQPPGQFSHPPAQLAGSPKTRKDSLCSIFTAACLWITFVRTLKEIKMLR